MGEVPASLAKRRGYQPYHQGCRQPTPSCYRSQATTSNERQKAFTMTWRIVDGNLNSIHSNQRTTALPEAEGA